MRSSLLHLAALLAGVALSTTAVAQNTRNTGSSADEVVELSPFEVKSEANRGYVASETLTGTRVATKIADLPYTVDVLTSEFFEDFAMFELDNNLTQIGSFTGLDIGGGFTLRGFSSTSQLRDGFFRLGRYGSSNIDRIEVIKGSNAAIYGRTSPGGMINFISKAPKKNPYTKFTLNFGSYDTQRGVLEATGPLLRSRFGKTSYILTLSQFSRGFDTPYSRFHNQEYYLALKHLFPDKSTLTFSMEYFLQVRHAPTPAAPFITDQKGTTSNLDDVVVGYDTNLLKYNAYGPNSELNRGNTGFTGVYERKLNDVLSTRVAGNYYRARRWEYNQNTGFGAITVNKPNASAPTTARGATPSKGYIFEDGGGLQADALATYWLFHHTVENRTLVTLDLNDYYRYDPGWGYGDANNPDIVAWNSARTITLDPVTLEPVAPLAYFPGWFQWGQETTNRKTKRRTTVLGGLLRQQSAFFSGRLLAFAGARFDAVRFQERDWTTAASNFTRYPAYADYVPGQTIRRRTNQLKPNFGLNYKLTSGLRAFASYSESYFVNQTDNPVIFANPEYKAEVATGYDYGIKGSYFDERLNFTVSGFYATRQNVRVSDTYEDPIGSGNYVTDNRQDGDQLVRGFEVDVNWAVNSDVSLHSSFGHVYSIYTDFGSAAPLAVGRRVNDVVPENGSVSLRYAPRQWLKGFSCNVGWTYCSSTPSEAPNAGDTYATNADGQRVLTRSTYQWKLRTPSYGLWNVGARYAFRRHGWDQTIGVNCNNVFDKFYIRPNAQRGDGRAFYLTYSIGAPVPAF